MQREFASTYVAPSGKKRCAAFAVTKFFDEAAKA